jgi:hypothetical protein
MLALLVRDSEDRVLCVQAHDLLCLQCKVYQRELDRKTPLSTHFRFQPIFTLAGSSLMSMTFFFACRHKNINHSAWTQLNTLIIVLAVMHHVYLLSRMLSQRTSNPTRNSDKASVSILSEKQPTFSGSWPLAPLDSKATFATADAPIHVEKCQEVMRALFRVQEAILFLQPLDMSQYAYVSTSNVANHRCLTSPIPTGIQK